MKSISPLILPFLALLTTKSTTFAQETSSSSSSTLHIPGPMEQSVTALSGTRSTITTSNSATSSHLSAPGPMEQSLTTTASDSATTATYSSSTAESSSPTTTSSESSGSAGNLGEDATRTGVSQSQDTSAADAVLGGGMKLEQVVMMGLGVGAALAV
ncbi:hypothetical protein M409DRAFT_27422 [Zasmidium cellare ATCC 36951]|uniref:REJ domain-containing protein n=1 Tax=Zasmidium cellare ATCC 36951 TaxID=1080233 RepID=A0A6A6C837_ZASCE|nr:uncharacterized protein M409DRAFT_27422 [Zasmidium cellare ATCC 36951]KAF2162042.1 hypothetical protein M409DRAFT_27422 [Zasmidium cellare ATCC 36951]